MKKFNRIGSAVAFGAMAVGVLAFQPLATRAADQVKGAQLLMTHVKTPGEVENLKPGDAVAMVCEKCKSVMVHYATAEKHIQVMTVGTKHLCPGAAAPSRPRARVMEQRMK